jgi:gluconokinase
MATAILVMGVSGSGKSTLAAALATQYAASFLEGDAFHSAANKAKMAAGIPLDDTDRWPWLDALGAALGEAARSKGTAVAACSALKRSYRTRLAAAAGMPLRIILVEGPADLLAARMRGRAGHYMPVSLLDSQLATLEPPTTEEQALRLAVDAPPEALLAEAVAWLADGAPQSASSSPANNPN